MRRLDATFIPDRKRPTERIVQFGEGNFLRAFLDWKIDLLNERIGGDWGAVVVRPIAGGVAASLNEQDGVYTTLVRGHDGQGREVSQARQIACVRREIPCYGDWQGVLALARDANMCLVASNTTEAGIAYDPACRFDDDPPASFPAKITRFLWERWSTLGRQSAPGFQFLPCELIEGNGEALRAHVLRHAAAWDLDPAFTAWVEAANTFYNTLVDRIVTGFPTAEAAELQGVLGYDDSFLVAAELFHLLVVERKPGMAPLILPLEGNDEGTLVTSDAGPYRERKVGILNATHTALCPLALLAGVETVSETVADPAVAHFTECLLHDEVLPFLSLSEAQLQAFAASVRRRFANPFIRHRWHDISLNAMAKFKSRNLPRLAAHMKAQGRPGKRTPLSLAAWAVFYLGRFPGAERFPPRDDQDVLDVFHRLGTLSDVETMIATFLEEESFWGASINNEALRRAVTAAYGFLTDEPFTLARLARF
jgi:tagaturonate reductase